MYIESFGSQLCGSPWVRYERMRLWTANEWRLCR